VPFSMMASSGDGAEQQKQSKHRSEARCSCLFWTI
jgi:hypothetical protein